MYNSKLFIILYVVFQIQYNDDSGTWLTNKVVVSFIYYYEHVKSEFLNRSKTSRRWCTDIDRSKGKCYSNTTKFCVKNVPLVAIEHLHSTWDSELWESCAKCVEDKSGILADDAVTPRIYFHVHVAWFVSPTVWSKITMQTKAIGSVWIVCRKYSTIVL